MKLAVVGGGWAGLAAAVAATRAGHAVTLFEAARQFGGRARSGSWQTWLTEHRAAVVAGCVLAAGGLLAAGARRH